MALENELQNYCYEIDKSCQDQKTLLKDQLLNLGYTDEVADEIADEFNRYDS
jgi:hypothetical protein